MILSGSHSGSHFLCRVFLNLGVYMTVRLLNCAHFFEVENYCGGPFLVVRIECILICEIDDRFPHNGSLYHVWFPHFTTSGSHTLPRLVSGSHILALFSSHILALFTMSGSHILALFTMSGSHSTICMGYPQPVWNQPAWEPTSMKTSMGTNQYGNQLVWEPTSMGTNQYGNQPVWEPTSMGTNQSSSRVE
jgi:hypothetical protein